MRLIVLILITSAGFTQGLPFPGPGMPATSGVPAVNAATCAANHGATTAAISCTFSGATTASTVHVFMSYYDFAPSTMTCTDDQGNTYTPPTNNTDTVSGGYRIKQMAATTVTASSGLVITCTYGGGATYEQILAYAIDNATTVDASAVTNSNTQTVTVGPINTSAAAVVLMAFIDDTAGLTATAGTICGVAATDGGGIEKNDPPVAGLRAEFKAFSTSQASCSATMTQNNSDLWAAAMVAIK